MTERKLTSSESNEIKQVIRRNLQAVHDFCEQHNLIYYLSDGTLLGAIRHQGMIPWDDDADVCMPRADYNRLLKLAGKLPKPYELGHFTLDKDYTYPFIKFMNSETEVIECFGDVKYTAGVWVDIFPLDGTYKNIRLRKVHYYIAKKLGFLFQLRLRRYIRPKDKESAVQHLIKRVLKPILFYAFRLVPKGLLFKLMDTAASHVDYKNANTVGNLYTGIGVKASHRKEWFAKRFLAEFDGYYFYAPKGYDGYLTNLYGDYMTPPPPAERLTHDIEIVSLGATEKMQS